ncbi:MAG TPA: TM2 domain-containing protein [Chitinophagaceae bacterium]|nr:TM2 domain-containing protein [Chitinophagaceae bacterium]
MDPNYFATLPGLEHDELMFLQNITREMTSDQHRNFFMIYQGRRRDPQTILICCIVSLFLLPGLQRFMLNQIGMGILFFFTLGLCFIGSIIDLVNYRRLTLEFNQQEAALSAAMAGNFPPNPR